jgi:hypothetical protein
MPIINEMVRRDDRVTWFLLLALDKCNLTVAQSTQVASKRQLGRGPEMLA